MSTIKLLSKCAHLIRQSKVCPKTNPEDWPMIIMFAHNRGYLYTNNDATAFVMAYRIPNWEEKWAITMPEKEVGTTLYVAWAVSEKKDRLSLMKMLRSYLRANLVHEIVYYRRNSDTDFKRISLRRNYEQAEVA